MTGACLTSVPVATLVLLAKDVLAEVRSLRAGLDRHGDRLDQMEKNAKTLLRLLSDSNNCPEPLNESGQIARTVQIRGDKEQGYGFSINGSEWLYPPPRLAQFLFLLITGNTGPDGVAGWHKRDSIAVELGAGATLRLQYVNQLVYQLRCLLQKNKVDRGIIDTDDGRGVRIRSAPGGMRVIRE